MNIVIFTKDFKWAGGVDFLHSIVLGLKSQQKKPVKIYILVDDHSIKANLLVRGINFIKFLPRRIKRIKANLQTEQTQYQSSFDYFNYVHEVFTNEDVSFAYFNYYVKGSLNKALENINADVVLPVLVNDFDNKSNVHLVGYLFDFVFKYFPHLYTTDFINDMEKTFSNTLTHTKSIIVNSASTAKDITKFFPHIQHDKVFVLPFAPYVNVDFYEQAVANDAVLEKYNIAEPYFMISNQFWLHKDHETAFNALKQLHQKSEFKNIRLISTGNMTDLSGTNKRELFLRNYVEELGINVDFLGHIPKLDQLALMLRSIAVLQPTKFEGGPGGGSVYIALACGINCIVSDIDVNKEIGTNPLVQYFKSGDPVDMSAKMENVSKQKRTFLAKKEIALQNTPNLVKLGETVLESIQKSIG